MIKETIIGEIKKSHYEVMRFTVVEDDVIGKRYLDVRIFFRNGRGHLIPTKKGVCMGVRRIQTAMQFMKQAYDMLTSEDAEDSVTEAVVGAGDAGEGG
ncbi:MAG: hypothetical protein EPN94_10990 [Nitrospirae bacterium]|nr:MAG: hypothetical protein EPN94_10990 [Nitrospirota bacterium]